MGCFVCGGRNGMGCFVRVTKKAWDVLSGVTKKAWDVLSGVANLCGMFCPGWQKWHGMFCPGWQKSMGCFVGGGKSMWDVLSGVAKNGMGCFVPGCFVRLPDQNCLTLMALLKEFFEKDDFEKISRQQNAWIFFIQHAKSERVKSIYSKVNLKLIVGDWTCAILFGGLCHMLSHHCIDQLYTCLLDWILYVPVNNF